MTFVELLSTIIIIYFASFLIYYAIIPAMGIKENNNYFKKQAPVFIIAFCLVITYIYGAGTTNINQAYNYITNNLPDYEKLIYKKYNESKSNLENCINEGYGCKWIQNEIKKDKKTKWFKAKTQEEQEKFIFKKQEKLLKLTEKKYDEISIDWFLIDSLLFEELGRYGKK